MFEIIGIILVYLIVILILYLVIVIFAPGFFVPKQPIQTLKQPGKKEMKLLKSRKNINISRLLKTIYALLPGHG